MGFYLGMRDWLPQADQRFEATEPLPFFGGPVKSTFVLLILCFSIGHTDCREYGFGSAEVEQVEVTLGSGLLARLTIRVTFFATRIEIVKTVSGRAAAFVLDMV